MTLREGRGKINIRFPVRPLKQSECECESEGAARTLALFLFTLTLTLTLALTLYVVRKLIEKPSWHV